VGGLQGQNVGYLLLFKSFLELAMLPVEDVPDHSPKRDVPISTARSTSSRAISEAWCETRGSPCRLRSGAPEYMARPRWDSTESLFDPQARNGDHPVVSIFPMPPRYCLPTCAVAFSRPCDRRCLVHDERSAWRGSAPGVFEHDLHPAPVYLLRAPVRLGEEPLKTLRLLTLRPPNGGSVLARAVSRSCSVRWAKVALRGSGERLVSPCQGLEEVVKPSRVNFERAGSGIGGQASGHGETSLPPLEHGGCPSSTNYR
jgi:hypothetical protein